MAAGKAIVSTAVDGCREVLEDGVTGLLVPPRDPARAGRRARCACWTTPPCARRWPTTPRARVRPLRHPRVRARDARRSTTRCWPSARAEPPRERALAGAAGARGLGGAARPAARPLPAVRDRRAAAARPRARLRLPQPGAGDASRGSSDYLADNGYVTLSADEYFQFLMGARPAPERAVVLTFDDGRGSLWSVGQPLLRAVRHEGHRLPGAGTHAVAAGPAAAHLGRRREGRADAAEVARPGDGDGAFLSWEEIEALSARGVFDFQSHTLTHARIHTGPERGRLPHPGAAPRLRRHGRAARAGADGRRPARARGAAGHAAARARSRAPPRRCASTRTPASAAPAWRRWPQAAARRSSRGPTGSSELRALRRARASPAASRPPRSATRGPAPRAGASARAPIEERTGRPVVHLCYPWHVAGPTARRLAARGRLPHRLLRQGAGTPDHAGRRRSRRAIARIGEDYVELLPGPRPARTWPRSCGGKWRRRLRGAS